MKKLILFLCYLTSMQQIVAQEVQWACRVGETNDQADERWSTRGVLGVPNTYPLKKIGNSWSIGNKGKDVEMKGEVSVKLQFCKALAAQQIIIVENLNPGSIKQVYVYDTKANEKLIYTHEPSADTAKSKILSIKIDPMEGLVNGIKIIAEPIKVPGANCIDAVGISTSLDPVHLEINVHKDPKFLPTIQSIGSTINTGYDEYSPAITPDGNTIYFARLGDPQNKGGENGDIDIWYSTKDDRGRWLPAKNAGGPLNNEDHNFIASIAADGDVLLLGNTYSANGKAQGEGCAVTQKTKSGWSFPKNMDLKNFYNNHDHVSFFMANNQKVLLMSIEDKDHSFGEQDIYVSFANLDGSWTTPTNVGSQINTVNSETNIFLSSDMSTLYFSSNGFTGYGGYDIYMSKRLDDSWQTWSKPVNLGPIVNTAEDEYCFVITADGKFAYGYKYVNEQQKHDIYVIGLPLDAELIKRDAVLRISGKVIHATTREPISSKITFSIASSGKEAISTNSTEETGNYEAILPRGTIYSYNASAPGFLPISETIEVSSDTSFVEVKKDIVLIPIEVGGIVKLNNVLFQKGLPELIETSFFELDNIYQFMKDNETVTIRLEGHTDNQGDQKGNFNLSQKRVKTVKDYLVKNGIPAKRIDLKAFGGAKPIASNAQEETRKLNRRVEFVIVRK